MEKQRVSVLKVLLLFVLFSVGVMTFKPYTVRADSQTFKTNGKTFTVVTNYNNGTTLYQKISGLTVCFAVELAESKNLEA